MDTYREPIYLSRIWTVYEQFVASKLKIPVTFVMPESASRLLHQENLQKERKLKLETVNPKPFAMEILLWGPQSLRSVAIFEEP